MVSLRRAVAQELTAKFGIAGVPEDASVGDSSGNGLTEHAVREIKAKTRSLAHAVFRLLGVRMESSHRALSWLVSWAAMTIYLGRRGLDGKTAWEKAFWQNVSKVRRGFRRAYSLSAHRQAQEFA